MRYFGRKFKYLDVWYHLHVLGISGTFWVQSSVNLTTFAVKYSYKHAIFGMHGKLRLMPIQLYTWIWVGWRRGTFLPLLLLLLLHKSNILEYICLISNNCYFQVPVHHDSASIWYHPLLSGTCTSRSSATRCSASSLSGHMYSAGPHGWLLNSSVTAGRPRCRRSPSALIVSLVTLFTTGYTSPCNLASCKE